MKTLLLVALLASTTAWGQGLSAGNPFSGSVPGGSVSAQPLALSLTEAIRLGVERNLGSILATNGERAARGEKLIALSRLLPRVELNVNESSQQINLAAFGFTGFAGVPPIVGPFGLFDARAKITQPVFNLRWLYNNRASEQQVKAAELSTQDARDSVVMIVAALYWQAVSGASRIDAVQSEIATADAALRLARDQKDAGLVPAIDVLRADVQLQSERQKLISYRSEFEKQKLRLAQATGIPSGQTLRLTDVLGEARIPVQDADEAIGRAHQNRTDFLSQAARVQAAELGRKGIRAARLPSVNFDGDYGTIGSNPANSHGTFTAKIGVTIPVFQGGAVQGADLQAQAEVDRQKAVLDELRSRIDFEIRTAMLDLNATAEQVEVNRSAVSLAREAEVQARDRFGAGVTNNLEVVQAQQGLATANENFINSLYAYNLAKVSLARAMGGTEKQLTAWAQGN